MKILITGGAGLIGSSCARYFYEKGHEVVTIDNYKRGGFFGDDGDTQVNIEKLMNDCDIEHFIIDIRDEETTDLLKKADVIIHTAAQPSHPKSIEIPILDFDINAMGTLVLLESMRRFNKDAIFLYCSTNKVYGERPNYYRYEIVGKRVEPYSNRIWNGFNEELSIDQCMHTPFGVSKLVGDLYTQEYSKLYGIKTGIFRLGCVTGVNARAVELQNWVPFFIKKALDNEILTIYGYGGFQVRDILNTDDLVVLFDKFIEKPESGVVYNVGGGRDNSISILEAVDLIEDITGNKLNYEIGEEREADHRWWITNLSRVRGHYNWKPKVSVEDTIKNLYKVMQRD